MGPRLELKHGLVPDADRLSDSADATLVTEPATGSKVRSKGNLYLVVSSSRIGGRAREATQLVAETIRREYYYDESAGVPICLEKAVRSANRKLRGSREGSGLPPGGIGIAMAVIRTNELYVATIGGAEAYLVRAARLLVPDHTQQPGLPADDALRVEVWRGEIAVGDSLLLVSRNLTEVVGTEELKNAVVTLHPQSAVEHLHHLFVAAGGDGPDAVLARRGHRARADPRGPAPRTGLHEHRRLRGDARRPHPGWRPGRGCGHRHVGRLRRRSDGGVGRGRRSLRPVDRPDAAPRSRGAQHPVAGVAPGVPAAGRLRAARAARRGPRPGAGRVDAAARSRGGHQHRVGRRGGVRGRAVDGRGWRAAAER